jgi:hypothetical protein
MGSLQQLPNAATPIERVLSRFDRRALTGFITVAIDLRVLADGDRDIEANGDEIDCDRSEDDFMYHGGYGPGCPIADPDVGIEDVPHDREEGQ